MISYRLNDDREPVPEPDGPAWAAWYDSADRHIANDMFPDPETGEPTRVSTVFLGIDHNFRPDGPPVLWETMIFGGKHDNRQWRYSRREDAEDGHAIAVALAKGLNPSA